MVLSSHVHSRPSSATSPPPPSSQHLGCKERTMRSSKHLRSQPGPACRCFSAPRGCLLNVPLCPWGNLHKRRQEGTDHLESPTQKELANKHYSSARDVVKFQDEASPGVGLGTSPMVLCASCQHRGIGKKWQRSFVGGSGWWQSWRKGQTNSGSTGSNCVV